jgi:phosphoenolpyruvate carboxylase
VAVGDRVLADGQLLDMIRRVRTFGISMAKLDLRQACNHRVTTV